MNFFTAQDKAKKNTTRLIFLFLLAICSLVILTNILFIGTFAYMETAESGSLIEAIKERLDQDIIIMISSGVIFLISLGSIYKALLLTKGGSAIAEMLGGELVPRAAQEADKRQLLNIVEEMAIAAGLPVPRVYLLTDTSINAFAAGQSHNKAVIGVTQGALDQLSRDELQGVIAHEFSHILNGDMRLNLNLISILHGILLIGIIGEHIVNSFRYRSSGKKDNGGAIIFIGLGLIIIGYAGTFFGKWIKASVSRQREYLADASAVQFTRNKDTIAGALKKIGGLEHGAILSSPSASEYSHAYFADGVSHFFTSMFATHPPLKKRIREIDPYWDGKFITPQKKESAASTQEEQQSSTAAGMAVAASILASADQLVNQAGTITRDNVTYSHELLHEIPTEFKIACEDAYTARAVVYAVIIWQQSEKSTSWELLKSLSEQSILKETKKLLESKDFIKPQLILPLLELAIIALKQLSIKQYQEFNAIVSKIIEHDKTIDLNEWIIQRLILQQLDEFFLLRKQAKSKYAYLGAVKNEAETLLSLIAHIEHKDNDSLAQQAFETGKKEIGAHAFNIIPREDFSLTALNDAIDKLIQLKPLLKPRILKACAAIIMQDGKITIKGVELYRVISFLLDCPAPPLQPSQLTH